MLVFRVALLLSCIGAGGAQLVLGRPNVCSLTKYFSETIRRPGLAGLFIVQKSLTVPVCCNGFTHRAVGDSCIATCPQGCDNGICAQPYFCKCNKGFFGHDCRIDINECLGGGRCSRGAKCINTFGSFRCECPGGFSSQGQACIEVDECAEGTDDCSHGCVNTPGSFRCTCPNGYFLGRDMKNCQDADECLVNKGGCMHTCQNSEGSFSCGCFEGYKLQEDGRTCATEDPCSTGRHNCSHTCIPEEGRFASYFCTCPSGCELSADQANCQDVNECVDRFNGCEQLCINIDHNCGGYQCDCRPGYSLNRDQKTCGDVNECLVDNGNCSDLCINTNGSFYCNCTQSGFILGSDGRSCGEVLCPDLTAPDDGYMICSSPRMTVSIQCHFSCNNGFELEGSSTPTRTCHTSGVWSGTEVVCEPLTCPNLIIPQLGVVQPCHQKYQETCTFTCSRGYYFDSAGNSTLQMSCDLDSSMTGVQWSDSPTCTRLNACGGTTNPCLHGSIRTCDAMGLINYECDCTGTGYVGKNCEIGLVTISEIPPLNVSQPYVITMEAKPEKKIRIRPISSLSARINFSPKQARFFRKTQTIQITITPKRVGIFTISFRLSGFNRNVFKAPSDQIVVVSDPTAKPPDDYFQTRGIPTGQLQPGCCDSPPLNICSSNVVLTSTCAWEAAKLNTPGVVFAKNGAFSIPLSVATAVIRTGPKPLLVDIDQSSRSCSNCTECAVEAYDIAPGDILNFYNTQALAITFIDSITMLLPDWISFVVRNSSASRLHTRSRHIIAQSTTLNMQNCRGFTNENYLTNTNQFAILMFYGLADIMVDSISRSFLRSTIPLCIAVDMCLGSDSPVFVALPSIVSPNLMNYSRKGWTLTVNGFSLSRTAVFNTSGYNILLRGSLNLSNVISFESVMMDFTIQGEGGFSVPDIERVFSNGLAVNVQGKMMGVLQLDLKIDSGPVLYSLQSSKESATFYIGGVNQATLCGQPTISGEINDNQLTRGSSVITAFLEIPPDLRHGDRYQFDCGLAYTIYTDASATVNGMVLNTSCHELRMDRLLIQDLVQTVYFGQQKQPACLPMDVDSSIDTYPVIGIAHGTGTAKLGHLMSQDQPLIEYGLNPQTGGYSAVMHDVTVMIYRTTFTTDVYIDSKFRRLFFSTTLIAGGYPFSLFVTASTECEWNRIRLNVFGVADVSSDGLIQVLQSNVMLSLRTKAETAVQRMKAAETALTKSAATFNRLTLAKNVTNVTVNALMLELGKIVAVSDNIHRFEQKLKTVSANITLFRDKLNSFCFIAKCNHSCIPGNVESICNISKTEEVRGQCDKVVCQKQTVREKVGFRDFRCESWADAQRAAQNCDCGATFGNCDCQVDVTWGIRDLLTTAHFCRFNIYQTVEISIQRTVQVDCVVAVRTVVTPTPCEVWRDCAISLIDLPCERANNACYATRANFVNCLYDAEEEARDIIAEIQGNERMIISINNSSKYTQLVANQQRLDDLTRECDYYVKRYRVGQIYKIRINYQAGLRIAELLNNEGFKVTNISFITTVTKEVIQTVALTITFTVGPSSTAHTSSVPFDFDNPELSLIHITRQLSNAIININSASRANLKRQVEVEASLLESA